MWVQFLGWEDRRWRRDCLETVIHARIPLGEPHGQRSLAGHSPRGHKELDTAE